MKIRLANLKDLPTLLAFGELMLGEAQNLPSAFNRMTGELHIKHCINSDDACAYVAESHGDVVGVFLGGLAQEWFSGEAIAFDYALFVLPEYRNSNIGKELVTAFLDWAKGCEVDRILVGTTTGVQTSKTVHMYESLGFKNLGQLLGRGV